MTTFTVSLIGVGLAMDAFAVSISEGIAIKRMKLKKAMLRALFFGFFQALMPLIGWGLGKTVYNTVMPYKDMVSFILLTGIGVKMIYEAYQEEQCENKGVCNLIVNLTSLAIATSIDALAVGFSFSFLKYPILEATLIIGIITFLISFIGVYLGNKVGKYITWKAELLGGFILIGMGVKVLFFDIIGG